MNVNQQIIKKINEVNIFLLIAILATCVDFIVYLTVSNSTQPILMVAPLAIKLICGIKGVFNSMQINQTKGPIKIASVVIVALGVFPSSAAFFDLFLIVLFVFYIKLNSSQIKNLKSQSVNEQSSFASSTQNYNDESLLNKKPIPMVKFIQSTSDKNGHIIDFEQGTTSDGVVIPADSMPVMCSAKGCLGVMYAIDQNDSYIYISNQELRESKIDSYSFYDSAFANIESMFINNKIPLKVHDLKHAHALTAGGDFESTILLFDEVWDNHLKHLIPNNAIVAVPTRDVCAFCDSSSLEGINELYQVINNIKEKTQVTISENLLIRKNNQWQLFSPQ